MREKTSTFAFGNKWRVLVDAAGQIGGASIKRQDGERNGEPVIGRIVYEMAGAAGIEPETAIQKIDSVTKRPHKPLSSRPIYQSY
jgi:hypothetical protein